MNKISMFLICDDNYVPYMATMIASICSNTESFLEFHVIGKGISEENKLKIQLMNNDIKNFSIDYKVFDVTSNCGIPYLILSRMTSSTFIRMMLPDLYPEIDKSVIMDVDMIALQDISGLWNESLDDCIFGAALDFPLGAYYGFKKKMDINEDCSYANCGLMLIDCKKWRDEKITEKCLKIEKEYRDKLTCADQDVINKVFLGNFKILDCKYNSLLGNEDDIIIRHFCYLRKPWLSKYNIEGELIKNFDDWWKYAKMTPFYNKLVQEYDTFNKNDDNSASKAIKNYREIENKNIAMMLRKKISLRGKNV
jgi:glycosyltransferase